MAPRKLVLFSMIGFVSFLSGGWLLQRTQDTGPGYQSSTLFRQVLARVAEYYVDELDESQLYDMAIDGMLEELNDPYTTFLRENDFQSLQLSTTGNYSGLGVRIDVRGPGITVITTLPDTPAERVGLLAGDRIVEVGGVSTVDWASEDAITHLKGEAGTSVDLTVWRAGYPELLEFEVPRARIHVNSVSTAILVAPEIGYLRLSTVSETSAREVATAVADLRRQGAKSLVFDLRNNPGGILEQGVGVADLFLPLGLKVVETRGRAIGSSQVYETASDEVWRGLPMVVLVNEFSASAAEIIAGALQDHDRALVVGRTTFGKGVAQLVFRISRQEALKVTTSRWYTPLGRSINKISAAPGETHAGTPLIPLDVDDESSPTADSAGTPAFVTAAGRELAGGGGIVPDFSVALDTLSSAAQAFARGLGTNVQVFREVLRELALELKGDSVALDSNFAVTEAMRGTLRAELQERGVEISNTDWTGAAETVDAQFSYELARYFFGRDVEAQRRASDDDDITKAVEMLSAVSSQQELFGLLEN
jgi:carboxyl-terminal processing protease